MYQVLPYRTTRAADLPQCVDWWKSLFSAVAFLSVLVHPACGTLCVCLYWRAFFLLNASSRGLHSAQGVAMTSYVTGALLMGQMAHEPYTLESYIPRPGGFSRASFSRPLSRHS